MPPPNGVRDLADITGYYNQIKWLGFHRSKQPNPFNILLLSEGFGVSDESLFIEFAETLQKEFFKIPPFTYCKPYINIFYCFIPSQRSELWELNIKKWAAQDSGGVTITYDMNDIVQLERNYGKAYRPLAPVQNIEPPNVSAWEEYPDIWGTAFSTYIDRSGDKPALDLLDRRRTIEIIKTLVLPIDFDPPQQLDNTSEGVWLNKFSKSFGAICVIANHHDEVSAGNIFYPPLSEIEYFSHKPDDRFFVMEMSGYNPIEYTLGDRSSFELRGSYTETFVHELGHSLDLLDEYIRKDGNPPPELNTTGVGTGHFKNAEYSNDSSPAHLESALFLNGLKWKHLITSEEMDALKSGNRIFTYDYMYANYPDFFHEFKDVKNYEIVPGSDKKVYWENIYLIEGAYYQDKLFRSNFECRMRHSIYRNTKNAIATEQAEVYNKFKQEDKERIGEFVFGSPEFCRVCNHQIRHHITGYTEHGMGVVDRNKLQFLFDSEIMPRIRKSFEIQNRGLTTNYSVASAYCELASTNAYIMFRNLPSPLNVKFIITNFHVSIYYRGVICDPTFYDLYRIPPFQFPDPDPLADSNISYARITGGGGFFKNREIVRGFVATIKEIREYFFYYAFLTGSNAYAIPLPPFDSSGTIEENMENMVGINDYLDRMTSKIYGTAIYKGPDNAYFMTGTHPFVINMKTKWDKWLEYKDLVKNNESLPDDHPLNYFRPLDMNIPISKIDSL